MNVSWIFCFTFLLLIHTVSVQSVTVEGVLGDTVILPCSFEQKPKNVFWRYRGPSKVCDLSGGKADCMKQDPSYRDRVNIFETEIEKGNFSISLSNMKESDAGLYTCNAPSISSKQEVELTVKAESRNTPVSTASPNGESRRRADGLLRFLLVCALLYSLVF